MAEAKRRSTAKKKEENEEQAESQSEEEGEQTEEETESTAEQENRSTEDEKNTQAAEDRKEKAQKTQTENADPVYTQIDTTTLDDEKDEKDLRPQSFPSGTRRELFGSWNTGHISWPKTTVTPGGEDDRNVGTPAQTLPKQAAGVYE